MEKNLINDISKIIYDKKGFNVLALDVSKVSSATEYVLIAEGNVNRHLKAIANAIIESLHEKPYKVEGLEESDWIVIDYLDIMIHLFTPSMRGKYQLERLWPEAQLLNIQMNHVQEGSIL